MIQFQTVPFNFGLVSIAPKRRKEKKKKRGGGGGRRSLLENLGLRRTIMEGAPNSLELMTKEDAYAIGTHNEGLDKDRRFHFCKRLTMKAQHSLQ